MTLTDELTTEATNHDLENGWSRESVASFPELRNPELLAPFKKAYMGEKSLTIKDNRTRKIVGSEISNGELSRSYLKKIMAEGDDMLTRRVPYRREALEFTERHPASYFAGQCEGPFVLVDIVACYATLYSRLTLDLTYRPDCDPPLLGLGRGYFLRTPELLEEKQLRNSLFGNLIRPGVREWRHGQPLEDAFPNRFFAPDLVGIVFDACHAIANQARDLGALSWFTDGGVFRPEEGRTFIEWLESAFGLRAEVRAEGPGWMFGATSYHIGATVTADVKKGQAREWPATSNLRKMKPTQIAWLAGIFKERVACH